MRHGPDGDIAVAACRTELPKAVSAPASARPITSSTRFLVAATTSCGRSSNVNAATQRPSSRDKDSFIATQDSLITSRREVALEGFPAECQRRAERHARHVNG